MICRPCSALVFGLALAALACTQPEATAPARADRETRDWPASERRVGGRFEAAAPANATTHGYRIALAQSEFLRVRVEQAGVDLTLGLEGPDGVKILEVDRPFDDQGPELLIAAAAVAGPHVFYLRSGGGSGSYVVELESLGPAGLEDLALAEAYQRFARARELEPASAPAEWRAVRASFQALGQKALEAEALERLGRSDFAAGRRAEAAQAFGECAELSQSIGDADFEMVCRNSLGASFQMLSDPEKAAASFGRALSLALPLSQARARPIAAAQASHGLGQALQNMGELQAALEHYQVALRLWPAQDSRRRHTEHNLGVLFVRRFQDPIRGRALLEAALKGWQKGDEAAKARTLSQLGRLDFEEARHDQARGHFEEALALRRGSDACGAAVFLARLAAVEAAAGNGQAAEERLGAARQVLEHESCPRATATVELLSGDLVLRQGRGHEALTAFERCAAAQEKFGDALAVAECLNGQALSERLLGRAEAARATGRRVLEIFERVRPTLLRDDLRLSFFSSVSAAVDLQIELLLEVNAVEEAFAVAENARARVLRDLLAEAAAGFRPGHAGLAGSDILGREAALRRRLAALETQRTTTRDSAAVKLVELGRAVDDVAAELETLRGELRRRDPRRAALKLASGLAPAEVRRALAADTSLVEFRLGVEESVAFVVDAQGIAAFALPPQAEIEGVAFEAAAWQRSLEWPATTPEPLCDLGEMLFAPFGDRLAGRKLVIVADGVLERLAFAALPDPRSAETCAQRRLLVESHEISHVPAAATLALARPPTRPSRLLAVLADPTYGSEGHGARALRGTGEEATAISAGLPAGQVRVERGTAATRNLVLSGALRDYRIVHLATHGLLDAERPLFSSLLFSTVDTAGRTIEGRLRAAEIYDLELPAELVVLSACETALGRQVRGEGLVAGLPRAFLAAGAERVLVSLWSVEDGSSRDLMIAFYRHFLGENLKPAAALRAAQQDAIAAGKKPHQWAGFVLLGAP